MSGLFKAGVQKLNDRLQELKQAYVSFVIQNPAAVEQIEKTVKASSYLLEALSKNYKTSIFITEFVSSACNVFAYVNTRLFLSSKRLFSKCDDNQFIKQLQQVLSVIEFSQAFVEITAERLGGSGARWAVILIICLLKALLRCVLLFVFESGIQVHSLSTLVNTSAFISSTDRETSKEDEPEVVYIGSRTGHKMRTLTGSSSHPRWSSPHHVDPKHSLMLQLPPTRLTKSEKIGECLHAIRPLIHVLSSGVCGTKSFIPWLTALMMDSSSHVLLQRITTSTSTRVPFNHFERHELRRRYANLMLYLLRSPIYEKYTGPKMLKAFAYLSEYVPLVQFVLEPLGRYIPAWQNVYFYTWTD